LFMITCKQHNNLEIHMVAEEDNMSNLIGIKLVGYKIQEKEVFNLKISILRDVFNPQCKKVSDGKYEISICPINDRSIQVNKLKNGEYKSYFPFVKEKKLGKMKYIDVDLLNQSFTIVGEYKNQKDSPVVELTETVQPSPEFISLLRSSIL
jgi:hypothetical protein